MSETKQDTAVRFSGTVTLNVTLSFMMPCDHTEITQQVARERVLKHIREAGGIEEWVKTLEFSGLPDRQK